MIKTPQQQHSIASRGTTLATRAYTLLALTLSSLLITATAQAGPKGGNVVAGQATITTPNTTTTTIHQSTDRAVINWNSFNIGVDETTQFIQPSSSSITLNRVTATQNPSQILGTLTANGTVILSNPDGILFGPNARVDVGGLIATTSDITNSDFMAGRMAFTIPGTPSASIVNQGNISIADHGIAAFVAPGVRNEGVITAHLGSVTMAAANGFTLDLYGDRLINLMIDDTITDNVIDVATGQPMTNLVDNSGHLSANGGTVALTAATARQAVNAVVNNSGYIEARTVGTQNGKIILGAQTAATKTPTPQTQTVHVSGTLDASGTKANQTGGVIKIQGEAITAKAATLKADGPKGGGRILIGGDYKGGNGDPETIAHYGITLEADAFPTATHVALHPDVTVSANATDTGNGGKVIVWADNTTTTAATITATGGPNGGNGGFIETSGKHHLQALTAADASAPNGNPGTWLLDPNNLTIGTVDFGFTIDNGLFPNKYNEFLARQPNSIIDHTTILAALNSGTDVRLLAASIFWPTHSITKTSGGDASLRLFASDEIIFGSGVTIASASGALDIWLFSDTLVTNNNSFITNGGQFDVTVGYELSDSIEIDIERISTSGGDVFFDLGHTEPGVRLGRSGQPWTGVHTGGGDFAFFSWESDLIFSEFQINAGSGHVLLDGYSRIDLISQVFTQNVRNIGTTFTAGGNSITAGQIQIELQRESVLQGNVGETGQIGQDLQNPETRFDDVVFGIPLGDSDSSNELIFTNLQNINTRANSTNTIYADGFQDITPFAHNPNLPKTVARQVIDYAELASSVYSGTANPEGFELATLAMELVPGFQPVVHMGNGLSAEIYQRRVSSSSGKFIEFIVVFRGTEDVIDLVADVSQFVLGSHLTDQYRSVEKIMSDLHLAITKLNHQGHETSITTTGHSLGGGLAQYAALTSPTVVGNVYTFNSAGLSNGTIRQIDTRASSDLTKPKNVVHVRTEGDLVSLAGSHIDGSVYNIDYRNLLLDYAPGNPKNKIKDRHTMTTALRKIRELLD